MKKNYLLIFFFIMYAVSASSQFGCGSAIPITNGYTQTGITTPGTGGAEDWNTNPTGTSVSEFYWDDDVYLFEYTSGATTEEITMTINSYNSWNGIGIFDDCSGTTFSNELDADASTVAGTRTVTTTIAPGNTVYIAVGQWGSPNGLDFDVTSFTVSIISCPDPSGLTSSNGTTTSVDLDWTENGSASEWDIEYGAPGFTPGNGTNVQANTNVTFNLGGLSPDNVYDIYVRSVCAPGDTSGYVGPISINTFDTAPFTNMESDSTCPSSGFIDISSTGTGYDISDDGEEGITLDFPFIFQGEVITEINIGNNGGVILGNTIDDVTTGGNLASADDGIYPWWDDLDSETGDVYYEVTGSAPNRIVVIQWNNICNYSGSISAPTVTFQAQLHEGSNEIYFVYDDVEFGGGNASDDFAANANIGVAGPVSDIVTSNEDPTYLMNSNCVKYYYPSCLKPVNLTDVEVDDDTLVVEWTPLGSETEWIIEYDTAGFVPGTGSFFTTTTTQDTIGGLNQFTDYSVYVRAICGPGDTSAYVGPLNLQTDPVCPAPLTISTGYTSQDTVELQWVSSGTETAWVMEYGPAGYTPGTGTQISTSNNPDTVFNLMPGIVYDFYIQADCGGGTTNPWTGPVTYANPIANDAACNAIAVPVDGSTTTYSNIDATLETGESTTLGDNTVWYTFTAPADGHVEIRTCGNDFDNFIEVYEEPTDCGDFNTFTLVDDATDNPFATCNGTFDPAGLVLCGLTPGNTYYLAVGSETAGNTGTFPLTLTAIPNADAGTGSTSQVCAGDMVTLSGALSGNDNGGVWSEIDMTGGLEPNGIYNTSNLAYTDYEVEYRVTNECSYDSTIVTVAISGPSQAGQDGSVTNCNVERTIFLTDALSGTIDLGGTWNDVDGTGKLNGSVFTPDSLAAGMYTFEYVVSNGVCPNDTSIVEVTLTDCLGTEDVNAESFKIFPNPTNGIFYIVSAVNANNAVVEITDLQGKVVSSEQMNLNIGVQYDFNLSQLERGVYLIRVATEDNSTVKRVVLQR